MSEHRTLRPTSDEYAPFYAGYVAKVPDGDVLATLAHGVEETAGVLDGVPEETAERGYAPGKWTLKEVLQHCTDAERIFAYRALRIGRGDTTDLAGWNEETYAPMSRANDRTMASLVDEFRTVRESTLSLLEGLPADAWTRRGRADGREVTVRGVVWITAGHLLHHLGIIRERYLA
ncbi:MAG: DinB family protein [Gemmatimonadota bacterium]